MISIRFLLRSITLIAIAFVWILLVIEGRPWELLWIFSGLCLGLLVAVHHQFQGGFREYRYFMTKLAACAVYFVAASTVLSATFHLPFPGKWIVLLVFALQSPLFCLAGLHVVAGWTRSIVDAELQAEALNGTDQATSVGPEGKTGNRSTIRS